MPIVINTEIAQQTSRSIAQELFRDACIYIHTYIHTRHIYLPAIKRQEYSKYNVLD